MIANPVLPAWVLVVMALGLGGFAIWQIVTHRRTPRMAWLWVSRLVMVALLITIAARPSIPGDGQGPSASGGLEVWFVVDTTSSMAAEDWAVLPDGTVQTRLDGVKDDIEAIVDELAGAQFSLVTFDAAAVQRVPLTADSSALVSAASVLRQEVTLYSRGSSIDEAVGLLDQLLAQAQIEYPDRERVLYYLGDGEQTIDLPPGSFETLAPYLTGGAVLGYGTDEGGRMLEFNGVEPTYFGEQPTPDPVDDPPAFYIQDYETGEDALSRIDEVSLRLIAQQLGVQYLHRTPDSRVSSAVQGISVGEIRVDEGEPDTVTELYWIFAIPLGLLALVQFVAISGLAVELRSARRAS